jgi:hypothetical protein
MQGLHSSGFYHEVQFNVDHGLKPSNFTNYSKTCIDENVTPLVDHSLSISEYDGRALIPVSGSGFPFPYVGTSFEDYLPANSLNSTFQSHGSVPNATISSTDYATVVARTNPSRPVVTPLTLIQDLVDIPRQLKDVGRLLKKGTKGLSAKDIANQNLGIQFGWLPLIQDVKDVLSLQSHIYRRVTELNRLYSSTGLKRRVTLDFGSAADSQKDIAVLAESAATVRCDIDRFTSYTKWGTVRWIPDGPIPMHPSLMELNRQATKAVSGLSIEGLTQGTWDIIPWTWLIDWFVPIKTYMSQYSNTVPAHPQHVNVMSETVSQCTIRRSGTGTNNQFLTGLHGSTIFTTKTRGKTLVINPSSVPFIGVQRLSILASLFIQRFK